MPHTNIRRKLQPEYNHSQAHRYIYLYIAPNVATCRMTVHACTCPMPYAAASILHAHAAPHTHTTPWPPRPRPPARPAPARILGLCLWLMGCAVQGQGPTRNTIGDQDHDTRSSSRVDGGRPRLSPSPSMLRSARAQRRGSAHRHAQHRPYDYLLLLYSLP